MLQFVALDFETANKSYNSAISLAVVTVEEGKIVKKAYSLIKPPFMNFDQELSDKVHGIYPNDVMDKPTFAELWPAIKSNHLDGHIMLAHNANFDMSVLRATLDHYDLNWPNLQYACTVKIARKVWPRLNNHKLNTVAQYLGITFTHHHALDDAVTCAQVALAACKEKGAHTIPELTEMLGVPLEPFIEHEDQVQTSFF